MIITVTLNAALDVTYQVPSLRPHTTHRVSHTAERPGGKGLNVARVLAALGHRDDRHRFRGRPGGRRAAPGPGRRPDAACSPTRCVPVAGATRRTVGVVDGGQRRHHHVQRARPDGLAPPSGRPSCGSTASCWPAARPTAVALCGSLPPGVPVGAYAELVREARAAGVYVLLDTSGEPLRRGLAARPDLIKPNADELAALTGFSEPARAARDARRRGARAVAASLGAEGMLAVTEEGGWQAPPPGRLAGNPTGAGDSAVAGLLSGHVEGLPWPERLARAVALSAATVVAPAAGEYDAATYAELLPKVRVTATP